MMREDYLFDHTRPGDHFLGSEPFEFWWEISHPAVQGFCSGVKFDNGLDFYFNRVRTNKKAEKLPFEIKGEGPVLGFRFCLSGRKRMKMPAFKEDILIIPNHWDLFYFRDESYTQQFVPDNTVQLVMITMDFDGFRHLLGDDVRLPGIEFPVGDGSGTRPFYRTGLITAEIQICLNQIFTCPYQGTARRFFFEAKTLELIAHSLDQLKSNPADGIGDISPGDIDRMHHAGRILTRDVQNPPSLSDLVREAGVSRSKFFKAFRRVHGISPTGYLRCARMEKALGLLRHRDMNITEIANHLGFSCGSHFARTFKQHFGVSPSLYHPKKDDSDHQPDLQRFHPKS